MPNEKHLIARAVAEADVDGVYLIDYEENGVAVGGIVAGLCERFLGGAAARQAGEGVGVRCAGGLGGAGIVDGTLGAFQAMRELLNLLGPHFKLAFGLFFEGVQAFAHLEFEGADVIEDAGAFEALFDVAEFVDGGPASGGTAADGFGEHADDGAQLGLMLAEASGDAEIVFFEGSRDGSRGFERLGGILQGQPLREGLQVGAELVQFLVARGDGRLLNRIDQLPRGLEERFRGLVSRYGFVRPEIHCQARFSPQVPYRCDAPNPERK